ncbi:MAG TPA: S8 family serine peptidase, partial [Acidimicrobiales bacterium]|nr:S8 family serine peptidase [Acidimicrobiales bacterium]
MTIRMRRALALFAAVLVVGVAPVAGALVAGRAGPPARLAAGLSEQLAAAAPETPLLVFVHGERRELAAAAVERAGLLAVGELRSIGVPVAVGTPAQIRAVAAEPGVTFVEHNEALDLLLDTARTATRADAAIAETVGDLGPFTGAGQSIAIVDGGVDGTHPMFADPETGQSKVVRNLRVACLDNLPGLTFRAAFGADPATCPSAYTGYPDEGGTNDPFLVDVTDGNDSDSATLGGHGTHVAGIAAGNAVTTADGRRLSGVAPGAKVVAIAVGASVTIYAANAALDWIARNHTDPCGDGSCPPITVVNNSYGGGGPWDPESATSKISAKLLAEGVTMVWANGNGDLQGDGGDGSVNRSGRDAANPTPGVIAVANYDDGETGTADGTLHPTSSRGDRSDPTTWPDLSAPGTNITSACRVHLTICDGAFSADPNYGTITGTSMAAPHVAGAVAVVQEAARAARGAFLAPAEVEDLLQATAHRFDFGADYVEDPAKPGRLTSFDKGHGLLDLLNAVRAVAGASPAPVSASAACPPDAPLVTDPAEDATAYAVVDTGANEASLTWSPSTCAASRSGSGWSSPSRCSTWPTPTPTAPPASPSRGRSAWRPPTCRCGPPARRRAWPSPSAACRPRDGSTLWPIRCGSRCPAPSSTTCRVPSWSRPSPAATPAACTRRRRWPRWPTASPGRAPARWTSAALPRRRTAAPRPARRSGGRE